LAPRLISLFSTHHPQSWLRQTPCGLGVWNGARFFVDCEPEAADALVVFDVPSGPISTRVPRRRRILFLTEPPVIKRYRRSYIAQFGVVVSPFPLNAPFGVRVIRSHSALTWWLGTAGYHGRRDERMDFEDLCALAPPAHSRGLLSVVTARPARAPLHYFRLALIERLRERLGSDLTIFGHGVNPIADKFDGIYGFDFHLALENNVEPHFWTEKLADAFLGWAHPLHLGAPRAADDFPLGAMTPIRAGDLERAVEDIVTRVRAGLSSEDRALIGQARGKLLYQHNIFAMIDRLVNDFAPGRPLRRPELVRLAVAQPLEAHFKRLRRMLRRAGLKPARKS
jgi:hypothetical protein